MRQKFLPAQSVIKNKKPCQSRVQNKQGKDNMDPDPHSAKKYNIYYIIKFVSLDKILKSLPHLLRLSLTNYYKKYNM